MAVPFEGQILYGLAKLNGIQVNKTMYIALGAHLIGFLSSGFLIRCMRAARNMMVLGSALCLITSGLLCFPSSGLWSLLLIVVMFVSGLSAAAWGYFFKELTTPAQRPKTAAYVLIFTNALMLVYNIIAVHISPYVALGLSALLLVAGIRLSLLLPKTPDTHTADQPRLRPASMNPAIVFLFMFVAIAAIEGGLMFQTINPFFEHLTSVTCCYWVLPYIAAIFLASRMPERTNRFYLLYVAMAMGGFSLLAFWYLPNNVFGYIVLDTLLMGAAGIMHLFLWGILGFMLTYTKNAAHLFGVGLTANSLGLFIGGIYGQMISGTPNVMRSLGMMALSVLFVLLVILPLLQVRLSRMFRSAGYSANPDGSDDNEAKNDWLKRRFSSTLTAREFEVMMLLLNGYTYKAIAAELNISENTVKTYVKNIYSKLKVNSRTGLIRYVNGQGSRSV